MRRLRPIGLFSILVLGAVSGSGVLNPAHADTLHAQPGSVMIFPLFDSTEMSNTLITVTNTNDDESLCANLRRRGDVEVHYSYIERDFCAESDTQIDLTPADTETVLARSHNPNFEVGYLLVEARDPETGLPIDFDFLIGSAIVVNAEFDFEWSYTPYAFEALVSGDPTDSCGRTFTDTFADAADLDQINFDDIEYSSFPDRLFLDNFFGEGSPDGFMFDFSNTLHLMSTDPNTDPNDENITFLGWNNNERGFSRNFNIGCHFSGSIQSITNAASQSDLDFASDDTELMDIETGWFLIRPALDTEGILGVFTQSVSIGGNVFTYGRELQYTGTRDVFLRRIF